MGSLEFVKALNYFNGIKTHDLSLSVEELNTLDGILGYSEIVKEILNNKSDINDVKLESMKNTRVYDLSSQILKLLFSSYKSASLIHGLYERVVVTGSSPFNGSVILAEGREYVTVGCNNKIQSIPTLTHEGTHVIVPFKYTKNAHTLDTLPILVEFITSIILDGMRIGDNNFDSSLIVRISSLKEELLTHDKEQVTEYSDEELYIRAYHKHNLYNYLFSFVYATNLLVYYLEGANSFLEKLDTSLKYDRDLYDFLRYYGISFTKQETIDTTIKLLKNTP